MYIAIEGIGGAGKGVQIQRLTDKLTQLGKAMVVFREPGGTPAGEALRELLLDKSLELNPDAQLAMFAAARFQLIPAIAKAEQEGSIVITDRCLATSYAYQGAAMGLGYDRVELHHRGIRWPDSILILDLDPATAVLRRKARDDRYTRDVEFMTKARRGYIGYYRWMEHGDRVAVIDASGTPDEVFARVWSRVQPLLALRSIEIPG